MKKIISAVALSLLLGAQSYQASAAAGADVAPTAVETLLNSAADQVEAGKFDKAAAALERALRIEPRNGEIWHLLGQVRLHQGHYDQAAAMARKSNSFAAGNSTLQQQNSALLATAAQLSGKPMALAAVPKPAPVPVPIPAPAPAPIPQLGPDIISPPTEQLAPPAPAMSQPPVLAMAAVESLADSKPVIADYPVSLWQQPRTEWEEPYRFSDESQIVAVTKQAEQIEHLLSFRDRIAPVSVHTALATHKSHKSNNQWEKAPKKALKKLAKAQKKHIKKREKILAKLRKHLGKKQKEYAKAQVSVDPYRESYQRQREHYYARHQHGGPNDEFAPPPRGYDRSMTATEGWGAYGCRIAMPGYPNGVPAPPGMCVVVRGY